MFLVERTTAKDLELILALSLESVLTYSILLLLATIVPPTLFAKLVPKPSTDASDTSSKRFSNCLSGQTSHPIFVQAEAGLNFFAYEKTIFTAEEKKARRRCVDSRTILLARIPGTPAVKKHRILTFNQKTVSLSHAHAPLWHLV